MGSSLDSDWEPLFSDRLWWDSHWIFCTWDGFWWMVWCFCSCDSLICSVIVWPCHCCLSCGTQPLVASWIWSLWAARFCLHLAAASDIWWTCAGGLWLGDSGRFSAAGTAVCGDHSAEWHSAGAEVAWWLSESSWCKAGHSDRTQHYCWLVLIFLELKSLLFPV